MYDPAEDHFYKHFVMKSVVENSIVRLSPQLVLTSESRNYYIIVLLCTYLRPTYYYNENKNISKC